MTLMDDVQGLRKAVSEQANMIHELETEMAIVKAEVKALGGLRKAAYWITGIIVAGAIGFGFSVLALVPTP